MYFEPYKDARGEFRWRFKATNGRTIADSGEGYTSAQHAIDGMNIIATYSAGAQIRRINC